MENMETNEKQKPSATETKTEDEQTEEIPADVFSQAEKEILLELEVGSKLLMSEHETESVKIKSTRRGVFNQILLTSSVLLTSAGCGMPIGYSSVILPQLYNTTDPLKLGIEMGSWIASVHSLATPLGSFISGPLMDRWGRRPALLIAIVPLIVGWVLIATASSHTTLLVGRMVAGIAVGITAAPAQVIIAETAEPKIRGMLIGAPFVSYSMGILLVYLLGSSFHWRAVAWSGTILPIFSFIALLFAFESPVWLARNNHLEKAETALTWLRGGNSYAKKEIQILKLRIDAERKILELNNNRKESFIDLMKQQSILKPMVLINSFHMLLILSGTYIVVFYAVDILSEFGGADINARQAAVLTALVRLIFVMFYCYLLNAVRRRCLVIVCGIVSGFCCVLLSVFMFIRSGQTKTAFDIYFGAACLLCYIGANTGFLAMPGCFVGELLPAKIRGKYAGYIFTAFNLALFFFTKVFPYIQYTLKTQGFLLIFGFASFGASILIYFLLPETKGKTLHEIEDYFAGDNWLWSTRDKSMDRHKKTENMDKA